MSAVSLSSAQPEDERELLCDHMPNLDRSGQKYAFWCGCCRAPKLAAPRRCKELPCLCVPHMATNSGDVAVYDGESTSYELGELTVAKDLAAGTIAGVAICLVGHPFDTIKVRVQTMPAAAQAGAVRTTLQMARTEGVLSVYKGMGSPLTTTPLINAVVFASYEHGKRLLKDGEDRRLTPSEVSLAGAYAGLINCLIVGPQELIKSRLQVQKGKGGYNGPIDCAVQTVKHGGVRALGFGMVPTILREVPAYAAQFYVYEKVKYLLSNDGDVRKVAPWKLMAAGAAAGLSAWLVSFPQDVIKNNIQVQRHDVERRFKPRFFDGGFLSCGRFIVQRDGWMGLWRGFTPCAGRALLANAVGFLAYEQSKKVLLQCE
ncbi:MAG: hypothetical protein MHM6MM_003789 [Cercozoa sp. M6MM]